VLAAVGVGVAVCAGLALWFEVASGSSGRKDGGIASSGFVASLDRAGVVEISGPTGRDVTTLTGLTDAPIAGFAVAADQRMTTLQSGTTVEVYPDVRAGSYAILTLQKGESLLPTGPFAYRDQAIVVASRLDGSGGSLTVLRFADDFAASLGRGDSGGAAGDPQTLGAFVPATAASQPLLPGSAQFGGFVDRELDWRVAGQPSVTLATSAQLQRAAGLDTPGLVHLAVYPDPAGDKLAVVLDPPDNGNPNVPIVLLDRHGRLLNALSVNGPLAYTPPMWSPDGRTLAFAAFTGVPALALWTPGRPPVVRPLPNSGTLPGRCIWDFTGTANLCTVPSATSGQQWILAPTSGPLRQVTDPNTPIIWLPGAQIQPAQPNGTNPPPAR
jgi:hypothetical protein